MITLDFETRSFCDLSGKQSVGTWAYSCHPTTTIMCLAYAIDDAPPVLWAPWDDCDLEYLRTHKIVTGSNPGPDDLFRAINAGHRIVAHNAFFERAIWENVGVKRWGWPQVPTDRWVCSMATARAFGLPGGLDLAVKTMGLPVKKGSQAAMKRTMKPRSAWLRNGKGDIWFCTPDDYRELGEYCCLDVEVERQLYNAIHKLTPREQEIWTLDQKINLKGIKIDRQLARGAWSVFDTRRRRGAASLVGLTGGAVETPNQTLKISQWVTSHGVDMPNCQADTVKTILDRDDTPIDVRRVLEVRQSVGGAAALKYYAFLNRATSDDRLRGELQYYGGHTGRWTSGGQDTGGGAQLHNAVKNKMDVDEAEKYIDCFKHATYDEICNALTARGLGADQLDDLITTLVRSVLMADPGKVLIDIDYAAIEARVMAWLAGEAELLEQFREYDRTQDPAVEPYRIAAADVLGVPPAEITKEQRGFGKVLILAPQYGMGAGTFLDTCHRWGYKWVTPELAEKSINQYRQTYWRTKAFWYDFEKAIRNAMSTGEAWYKMAHIVYDRDKKILGIALPNSRWLWYHQCVIKDGSIQYFGRLSPPKSGYGTVYSWGGKFSENYDQALSRDYMALAMLRADKIPGVDILLTIHDEILMQVPEDKVDELYPLIRQAVMPAPVWADGIPIEIGHWVGKRFRKD